MKYPITEQELFNHRPKPFFFITTHDTSELTEPKVREKLSGLKSRGFGGIVLFNKPPHGFDADSYLSPEWFVMVRTFCKVSKELNLIVWINDGFDFPPGGVAGKVQEADSTLGQKCITLSCGKLCIKEIDWGYPAFELPRSGLLFNQFVHEAYEANVGDYFGDPIVGFFSDADNRRVPPGAMLDPNHPAADYFPWSDNFGDTFRNTYGYDILPFMKEVIARKDIPQAADYWEHSGRLFQSWFKNNYAWLRKHGLQYTGHSGDTSPFLHSEAVRSSAFTEGRFSDIQSNFDYPGTDQELLALDGGRHMRKEPMYTPHTVWGDTIHMPRMKDFTSISEDMRAKQAGSTAFMYRKPGAMCEMFAASNFGVSPEELRQIAAFQIMQGITFIVPHAYHYRFRGKTKYFAPPEYSEHGQFDASIRELNDELARICAMMEKGRSICPVALLDPTTWVWRNNCDTSEYLNAFTQLNRLPFGYTVIDAEKIIAGNYGFRFAVCAGFTLPAEQVTALEKKGIRVVSVADLEYVEKSMDCGISWNGEGKPHFLRKEIDGEEFVFIANIESTMPIRGTLTAYGRKIKTVLYPGDIRYMSAEYDDLIEETEGETVYVIPQTAEATPAGENIIPMERFLDSFGKALTKEEPANLLNFPFSAEDTIGPLRLHLPLTDHCRFVSVLIDGISLDGETERIYDDPYIVYTIPQVKRGEHSISLLREGISENTDRILLTGEFSVRILSDSKEYKKYLGVYNISCFIPEKAEIVLSEPNYNLDTGKSWAEQGYPFYSGKMTYRFPIEIPESGDYAAEFSRIRDVAEFSLNGMPMGKRICRPYRFTFHAEKGTVFAELHITNSAANAMEGWCEESGILDGGRIVRL